jgi:hypothetical protein
MTSGQGASGKSGDRTAASIASSSAFTPVSAAPVGPVPDHGTGTPQIRRDATTPVAAEGAAAAAVVDMQNIAAADGDHATHAPSPATRPEPRRPPVIPRDKLYSVPDLKDRGWTATAIKKFLPVQPDDTRDNPHYSRAGAAMKFWWRTRVHRAEKTKKFLAWRQRVSDRERAAARGVGTRVDNMVEQMRSAVITIDGDLTADQIYDLAERTHGRNYQGDPGPFRWSSRTARNCIRHNLTNYERLWSVCNRGNTGSAAYAILRARVDALIDEAYPQFADYAEPAAPAPVVAAATTPLGAPTPISLVPDVAPPLAPPTPTPPVAAEVAAPAPVVDTPGIGTPLTRRSGFHARRRRGRAQLTVMPRSCK